MIDSRDIRELHPVVQARMQAFLDACEAAGIRVILTSTYRDHEMQSELYARGRTKPGSIVTNARPGESFHQWRCAADFVPVIAGKAIWNDQKLWTQCGKIAESVGLEWSGRWKGSFRETAHVQYTGGLSLAKLQAGATPL